MQTRDEVVKQVRERMPQEHQSCDACWNRRLHSDDEYRVHPGEGRSGARNEKRVAPKSAE
jgi:hypothetical protein